jgi:septum formation protein
MDATMIDKLKNIDLILGSQSPRRKELLQAAGFEFRTWAIPTDESFPSHLQPADIAEYLCRQKALPFNGLLGKNSILITADTIVVKDGLILNKAANAQEAFNMLSLLNNAQHQVITGVCITSENHQECFHNITHVFFNELSHDEIHWYIENYKPFDKAGAYGIQEWIGLTGINKIEGCYYNVVGLPVPALYQGLKNFLNRYY